ncbi:MAG: hypothetical protein SFY80_05350, partial [Verrucomicrobiota bacterium]|nr:hypothetical protein [Verrucomicrobiota bacterium]
ARAARPLQSHTADSAALSTAYKNNIIKKKDHSMLIQTRDEMVKKEIKPRLIQYLDKVKAVFPKDHLIRVNVPTITQPKGGAADKVELLGIWDAVAQKATLTWTPSARSDLLHYEIRACNAAPYSTNEESAIATVAKDVLTYQTSEGLASTGSTMLYKVYVVTNTRRERGSNVVKVVRTAAAPLSQAA